MSQRGWDEGEWDEARWDIFTSELFLRLKKRFQNIATPNRIKFGETPEIKFGEGKTIKFGVFTDDWERLKRRLEKV